MLKVLYPLGKPSLRYCTVPKKQKSPLGLKEHIKLGRASVRLKKNKGMSNDQIIANLRGDHQLPWTCQVQ